jgi:hypothetical protein
MPLFHACIVRLSNLAMVLHRAQVKFFSFGFFCRKRTIIAAIATTPNKISLSNSFDLPSYFFLMTNLQY